MIDSPENSSPRRNAGGAGEPMDEGTQRRNFVVELSAILVGVIINLVGLVAGLVVFFDPLGRKNKVPLFYHAEDVARDGFLRVASLESVPDDGVPRRFPVIADLIDAWTFSPDQPIGAVWLRRKPGNRKLQVFHATCPHAGCAVSYRPDPDPSKCLYHCPCHNSAFDLDGHKIDLPGKKNPSPRPMDALEYQIDDHGHVLVKFVNFYTGIPEKKARL